MQIFTGKKKVPILVERTPYFSQLWPHQLIRPLINSTKGDLSEENSTSDSEQDRPHPAPAPACPPEHPDRRGSQPVPAPPSPPQDPGSESPRSASLTISHDSIILIASSEDGAIAGSGDEYIWDEEQFSTPAGPSRERTQEEAPIDEEGLPAQGPSGRPQPSFQDLPPESILNIEDLNEDPQVSPIQRWGWNTPSQITRAGLSGEEIMRPVTSSRKTRSKKK